MQWRQFLADMTRVQSSRGNRMANLEQKLRDTLFSSSASTILQRTRALTLVSLDKQFPFSLALVALLILSLADAA